MFFDQLFRLLSSIFEIGFALVLVVIFIVGITFIALGFPTVGVLIAGGTIWFVTSAIKNKS